MADKRKNDGPTVTLGEPEPCADLARRLDKIYRLALLRTSEQDATTTDTKEEIGDEDTAGTNPTVPDTSTHNLG